MDESSNRASGPDALAFLAGGGEMGRRIRDIDWSGTPLGPIGGWPQSLRSALSICLNSNFPIAVYWGGDLVLLYNDEWSPIPGEKHPWALGRPAREAWPEIWHIIEPLFLRVLTTGEAVRSRDQLLPMHRHGFTEECYFDYTFSPVRGEGGGVEGVFNAVLETTTRVIGERRLRTLRELATWKTGEARSAVEACQTAAQIITENPHDLPFALLYLLDGEGRRATLAGRAGMSADHPACPAAVDLGAEGSPWPLGRVTDTGKAVEVHDLPASFGPLPGGAWPEPPQRAVVLPLAKSGHAHLAGFVVAGVSPRLALNDDYRGFLDLLAGHVAAAVANAQAYEEERRRAEALAELDRAKTAFFSNVSHEFRTPLTLMLGPVEDTLGLPGDGMVAVNRETLEVVRRNGRRLQKLVNTLLDFSRIEAGRVQASFEPTDLAPFTAELASNFRSACERAGLKLLVDCPPLAGPVYVDREMWEKVVLNLLSNAFKFTFEGGITVALRQAGPVVELAVRDTGTGIPPDQMSHLFERFHRVEGANGRTQEGSGIGLALVRELARLHGGDVRAESRLGEGSTFTVTVPVGTAHLPAERVRATRTLASTALAPNTFVEEALHWLPVPAAEPADPARADGGDPSDTTRPVANGERPRILLADDNADMRDYIRRLLGGRYEVTAVADGLAALDAARRESPDLLLSDVMMPGLDGFGLIRELRADPTTLGLPVILLSARAGEEARVEGLQAGADDYLVKPFSARELQVRVAALLQITRLRREADEAIRASEERFRTLFESMDEAFCVVEMLHDEADRPADYRFLEANPTFERHTGFTNAIGRTIKELVPDHDAHWFEIYGRVAATGEPTRFVNEAKAMGRWYDVYAYRVGGPGSQRVGILFTDITERRRAGEALAESERRFRQLADAMPQIVWSARPDGTIDYLNRRWHEFTGLPEDTGNEGWGQILHPDDARPANERWAASLQSGAPFEMEVRLLDRGRRAYRWHLIRTVAVHDEAGGVARWFGTGTDIDGQKRAEESSRYLAEASAALAGVVDYESTLQKVANLAVPYFADWSAVDVANGGGSLRRLAVAHKDADKISLAHELMREYPPDPETPGGAVAVLRTGKPEIVAEITDDMLVRGAKDERHLRLVRSLGLKSYICVPLVVSGKPLGVLTFATAESGRTYTEADLALAVDLAHRAAVAVENTQLYQALRDADRRKDEFLATLAHELRNPLAPIRNSLQILKMPRVDAETVGRSRDMMERQVHHLVRLVDDLLDVSRVMRGKIELRRERVELATIVARAVETVQPLVDAQGHQLSVRLPPESLPIDADPVRLTQVVGNLLTNAAKYTEPGGHIWLTAGREGDTAVLRVRDTGIGVSREMLPRIFELFVQADHASTKAQGGLGIGLTLVKNLVEMHHGTVEARSDGLGQGSEFAVRLPLSVQGLEIDQCQDMARQARQPPPSGNRLLVVDDNQDAANSLAMLLRLQGHEVRVAFSGPAALEITKAYAPEVVFLDIGMPGMDGHEVARRMRGQPGLEDVVLAALTGWGQQEDRRRTAEAGFDHHLVKPPEPKALESVLAELKRRGA